MTDAKCSDIESVTLAMTKLEGVTNELAASKAAYVSILKKNGELREMLQSVEEKASAIGRLAKEKCGKLKNENEKLKEQLQQQGRLICYIGDGTEHGPIMQKSMMSISIAGIATIKQDAAQVILSDQRLGQLPTFFKLADEFNAKQRFNLAWPLLMDSIDIFTTVFVHFGLVYSVLFAYTGTLVSALNANRPLQAYKREETTEHTGLVSSYARFTD